MQNPSMTLSIARKVFLRPLFLSVTATLLGKDRPAP
jgi:hypothetical protein